MTKVRYRYLDLLRGLAAFSVLVWHYQHFFYPTAGFSFPASDHPIQPFYWILAPLYDQGNQAVELFWSLSGFVFAATYASRRTQAGLYFVNRFARLYPLHLITLLIVALLQFVAWRVNGHFQIYPFNDGYHFLLNIFMIQFWGLQDGFSFNAPTWSVSIEVAILIAYFFTIPVLRRFGLLGALIFIVAAAVGANYSSSPFLACALCFYSGAAAWLILQKPSPLVGVIVTLTFAALLARHIYGPLFPALDAAAKWTLAVLAVAIADRLMPLKTTRADWFGNATYSTYLLHVPLQITVLIAVQMSSLNQRDFFQQDWVFVSFIGSVFALGVLSYRYVEMPCQRFLKRKLCRPDGSGELAPLGSRA